MLFLNLEDSLEFLEESRSDNTDYQFARLDAVEIKTLKQKTEKIDDPKGKKDDKKYS